MTTSSDSHTHHPHNHINGTVHASRIPRSLASTLNDKKTTLKSDETISPASRKITKRNPNPTQPLHNNVDKQWRSATKTA
jgi:hypothetical protein